MAKVQRSIDVDVPMEQLFAVIIDYEKYNQFLSDVKRTSVKRNGNLVELTTELGIVGTSVKYTLKVVEEPPKKMTWSLIEGQFMKSNDGGWLLESLGESRTRATYHIEIALPLLVPKSVVGVLVDSGLPKMLESFKKRAESLVKK